MEIASTGKSHLLFASISIVVQPHKRHATYILNPARACFGPVGNAMHSLTNL